MLIWINNVEIDDPGCNEVAISALNCLGDAAFYGRHIVLGPRPLLTRLASHADLSRSARGYYKWMAGAFTQFGGLVSQVNFLIADAGAFAPSVNGSQWSVPLSLFSDPDFLTVAELICENNSDFEVYDQLARLYAKRELPGCQVRLRSRPGGGNTTSQVLASAMTSPGPVSLCLVDSDRDLVLGAAGATAKRCMDVYEESWRINLHVLDGRELENLVPVDVMVRVLEGERVDTSVVEKFSLVHRDLALFACLKTGEQVCRFHAIGTGYGGYQRTKIALGATARSHDAFASCGDECSSHGCVIIPKLGEDFLAKLGRWLADGSNWRKVSAIGHWRAELVDAIRQVVHFGIALPRRAL